MAGRLFLRCRQRGAGRIPLEHLKYGLTPYVRPAGSWLLRNVPLLRTGPLEFLVRVVAEYGPAVHFQAGKSDFYLTHDPDLLRDILLTQSKQFEKFPRINRNDGLFGDGLLTSEEPLHMRQRRIIQPHFHRDLLGRYADVMVDATRNWAASLVAGEVRDVTHDLSRLALEIVSRALFSADTKPHAETIAQELDAVLLKLNSLVLPGGSLSLRLPLPETLRYRRALRKLDEVVSLLIRDRVTNPTGEPDLLTALLDSADPETGAPMEPRQLRDEVMTLLIAGHETTANALAWALHLLAGHPEVRTQMAAEVRSVAGDRPLTAADYPRLRYTEAVFRESLRLYPAVWILGRKALTPYSFGELSVPAGAVFVTCLYILHRRPKLWPDVDQFLPERWLNGSAVPKFGYLPFGAGSRLCVGERFAWMEGTLVLATLAQSAVFERVEQTPVIPQGLLTLRPQDGLRLRVRPVN